MIATLFGEVTEKNIDNIILDVSGIGYELKFNLIEISKLSSGNKIKVYIHEHIKEDAYDLYGFISKDTQNLFKQLLTVKNVGPKAALSILSSAPANEIKQAIASGNVKFLMAAKGVGRRAAEQVVVELRDKIGLISSAEDVITRSGVNPDDEAFQALVALGFEESEAAAALTNVDKKLPTTDRVKLALKNQK